MRNVVFDDVNKIHLVSCKLDGRIYVRKSIEKVFAIRNRDVCTSFLFLFSG
jgi:hypothetical protein